MIRNKVVAILLAAIFACTSFVTTATASEVNTSLAANPAATLSAIDAMNLTPLSDEKAGEVRGEVVWAFWIAGASIAAILYTQYKLYYGGGVSLTPAGQDLYVISITGI